MLTQVPAEQKSFLTFNGFFTNINRHPLKSNFDLHVKAEFMYILKLSLNMNFE